MEEMNKHWFLKGLTYIGRGLANNGQKRINKEKEGEQGIMRKLLNSQHSHKRW